MRPVKVKPTATRWAMVTHWAKLKAKEMRSAKHWATAMHSVMR
jgi:hypothetical protein